MWRRLYLNFPDSEQARRVSDELEREGISREQIHAMNNSGGRVPGLPSANEGQQHDRVWFWEQLYWNSNLILFGVALIGFLVALFTGAFGWAVFTVGVMLLTFLSGKYFAERIPHAHLGSEMKEPLKHGEVVLMVDVPSEQLGKAEQVAHRHPEAGGNVVGWTMPGVGI